MGIVDWLGILLCVVVWLPVHGGLWLIANLSEVLGFRR
jgi:hypothetical protein